MTGASRIWLARTAAPTILALEAKSGGLPGEIVGGKA